MFIAPTTNSIFMDRWFWDEKLTRQPFHSCICVNINYKIIHNTLQNYILSTIVRKLLKYDGLFSLYIRINTVDRSMFD